MGELAGGVAPRGHFDPLELAFVSQLPEPSVELLAIDRPREQVAGQSGFTLHTLTGFHRPDLHHYYGFICHPARFTQSLELLLGIGLLRSRASHAGLPRLLFRLPVNDPIPNHKRSLSEYRASRYFAR